MDDSGREAESKNSGDDDRASIENLSDVRCMDGDTDEKTGDSTRERDGVSEMGDFGTGPLER